MTVPPPVEHLPLRGDRAGRRRVDDVRQRRHVVAGLDVVVELEQPVEHGRDHVRRGDVVALDPLERALGGPLVHEDHAVAAVQRRLGEVRDGRVVQRRDRQVDVVGRGHPEQVVEERAGGGTLVGIHPGQRPLDALRPAGGARRVGHELAGGPVGGLGVGVVGEERVPVAEPVDAADGEPAVGGQVEVGGGLRGDVGEPLVGDEDLRLRVVDDVGDLGAGEVVVHRDDVPARLLHRQQQLHVRGTVGEKHRDHVVGLQTEVAQRVGDAVARGRELPRRERLMVRGDERVPVRLFPRDVPESQRFHDGLPSSGFSGAGSRPAPGARNGRGARRGTVGSPVSRVEHVLVAMQHVASEARPSPSAAPQAG